MDALDGKIKQANGRLKSAKVGVRIDRIGDRLYLRATLPPKPGSAKLHPFQQRIALGLPANGMGLQQAEKEARKVGGLLICGEFTWEPYTTAPDRKGETVGEWIAKFELDYFSRRERSPQSLTTWADYQKILKRLPQGETLSGDLMLSVLLDTNPDTRTRKLACTVLGALAKFAGIEFDPSPYRGSYSPSKVTPRDIPSDLEIARAIAGIRDGPWRWTAGMMATYGLRNHEVFHLDMEKLPILQVVGGKTGSRLVWPIYPEWIDVWDLGRIQIPECTGKDNTALGNRVTHAFKRLGLPFAPYDLRHAWAIRSMAFGLDLTLAAAQMGHSVQVHCQIYHAWITEDVHDRAYRALMANPNRPLPPALD